MKTITDIKQINFQKLEYFVFSHPSANFFQSTKAYLFFKEIYNYTPFFIIVENKGQIVGSLLAIILREGTGIKGFLSRRCIVWGGPLILNNDEEVLNMLLSKLNYLVRNKAIYTEFRNLSDWSDNKIVFINNNYKYSDHLNYIVSIPSYEKAKANLSSSKKRQINKSIKNRAEIIEAENIEQVKEFFILLKKLYKEKVNKPLPQYDLFKAFFEVKELGKYLLIKHEDKIIGGIMCPIYKDTIYEWYISGADGDYKDIYPSVLATWAPIEYAAHIGLKYFDFMGAGKPEEDYGVREFKSKFGGDLVNYGRFMKINNQLLYKTGEWGVKVLGKISK